MRLQNHRRKPGYGLIGLLALVFISVWQLQPAWAKAVGSITVEIALGHVDAVILAHLTPSHQVEIEKVYFGPLSTGDRFPPLDVRIYRNCFGKVPEDLIPKTQFVFFLVKSTPPDLDHLPSGWGPGFQLSPIYAFDPMVSKVLVDGRVYIYMLFNAKNLQQRGFDGQSKELVSLEQVIAQALTKRKQWQRAQDAQDPTQRLELLRPFFIPNADDFDTYYDTSMLMYPALEEVVKSGPSGIPFLQDLLTLPHFQDDFKPIAWSNFGTMHRKRLQGTLTRLESNLRTSAATSLHD